MTTEIDKNGNIWISSCNKYQEASYYARLAKKPDQGISARQIKASIDRRSVRIKSFGEGEDEKTD